MLIAAVLIACVSAAATGGVLAVRVRSWVYQDAQELVLAEFEDEVGKLRTWSPHGIPVVAPDYAVVVDGRLIQPGFGVAKWVPPGMQEELEATPTLYRFTRLPNNQILIGHSLPKSYADSPRMTIYTLRELGGVPARLRQLMLLIAVATLVSTILVAGLGFVAVRSLVQPLRRLELTAKRVIAGDDSVRLAATELTELRDMTSAFNQMLDRQAQVVRVLKEEDRRARRFVSDVSHELRSPLAAMIPAAEVLQEELQDGDISGRSARLISTEIAELAQLVEDLLEMTRLDSGGEAVMAEPLDLIALTTSALRQRGWDTVTIRAPRPVHLLSDRRRILSVVTNLIGNALRHGASPVSVTIMQSAQGAVVEVRDHGPGIPTEHSERVFERMYKVSGARTRSGGMGLGLAIARENARLLGGDIGYRREGTVSVFTASFAGPSVSAIIPK